MVSRTITTLTPKYWNEQIPKVAHVLPWDTSKSNGSRGVHVTRGLADNLTISPDGIDGHSVGVKDSSECEAV
jgi:hypothetical protein